MNDKEIELKLTQAFDLLKEVVDETGVNLIDNYSYREYAVNQVLKDYLPSISKKVGRTGDDAIAPGEGYYRIEQKSGTNKRWKTLSIKRFPDMLFDKQSDPVRREYVYTYDGFSLAFFDFYKPYPTAVVFISKYQVEKLHPLFRKKQDDKIKQFEKKLKEGKNIGHDPIIITLQEILDHITEEDLFCWLHGSRIDSKEFFQQLRNTEIKINQ
jgi:hypothetical protein